MEAQTTGAIIDSSDIKSWRRILIWGGGGKTTLARAIGAKTGLPVVELDALFWLPDWGIRPDDEFRQLVKDTLDSHENGHSHGWVADGQYMGVLGPEVVTRADMLIWVEMPWRVIFWRTLLRTFRRAKDKKSSVAKTLNPGARHS